MTTGSFEGDTARDEELLEAGRDGRPVVPYRALWGVLLFGWIVSYADRTLTGPVDGVDDPEQGGLHRRRGEPRRRSAASSARCSSWATC